jgi:hypothetical protein
MASTIEALKHLSNDLGINEDVLMREGIIEYIKSKIKVIMKDRMEIMSRYRVSSFEEFEKGLEEGKIPEHPGWEDLIILENLENSINKFRKELSYVKNIPLS